MLHRPRRRRAARRVRHAGCARREPRRHHARRPERRRSHVGRVGVRRDRRFAVRVLHARHHHAVRGRTARDVDRGLAAHLCRCTGWVTVRDALTGATSDERDWPRAAQRAGLEGGVPQLAGIEVPLGGAPFADDTAPRARAGCRAAAARLAGRTRRTRPDCSGSSGRPCSTRASAPRKSRVGARPSTRDHLCSISDHRCRTGESRSRRHGSSPRTSSPTRRGAIRVVSPRRRSRTAARSAARNIRPRPRPHANSRTGSGERSVWCIRVKTSCGSGPSGRRSRRSRSRAATSSRSTESRRAASPCSRGRRRRVSR